VSQPRGGWRPDWSFPRINPYESALSGPQTSHPSLHARGFRAIWLSPRAVSEEKAKHLHLRCRGDIFALCRRPCVTTCRRGDPAHAGIDPSINVARESPRG
jgi:hypothetical protein